MADNSRVGVKGNNMVIWLVHPRAWLLSLIDRRGSMMARIWGGGSSTTATDSPMAFKDVYRSYEWGSLWGHMLGFKHLRLTQCWLTTDPIWLTSSYKRRRYRCHTTNSSLTSQSRQGVSLQDNIWLAIRELSRGAEQKVLFRVPFGNEVFENFKALIFSTFPDLESGRHAGASSFGKVRVRLGGVYSQSTWWWTNI